MAGLSQSEYKSSWSGQSPLVIAQLGTGGVNLVKDPLEMADNELLLAQNAEPYREQGVAGVRKRPGLQKINANGAVAPIIGSAPIDNPQSPDPGTAPIIIPYGPTTGTGSTDGGTTFHPITLNLPAALLPNAKYTLGTGQYEFLPCFPICPIGTTLILGGHAPGQILVLKQSNTSSTSPTSQLYGVTVFNSVTNDDTFVLSGLWHPPVGDPTNKLYCVCITTGGQCALFNPFDNSVITLPNFTSNALATGSPGLVANYLWVANGTNISSIDPRTPTAWVDNSASGVSVAQLTGLAEYNGVLYAGSKTTGTNQLVITKAVPNADGTATISTSLTITTSTGPNYTFGPYLRVADGYPLFATVSNDTNLGTLGGTDAGAADQLSTRQIIAYTLAQKWRGVPAQSGLDLQNNANLFNASTNRTLGPITTVARTHSYVWIGWVVDTGVTYLGITGTGGGLAFQNPNRSSLGANVVTWPIAV